MIGWSVNFLNTNQKSDLSLSFFLPHELSSDLWDLPLVVIMTFKIFQNFQVTLPQTKWLIAITNYRFFFFGNFFSLGNLNFNWWEPEIDHVFYLQLQGLIRSANWTRIYTLVLLFKRRFMSGNWKKSQRVEFFNLRSRLFTCDLCYFAISSCFMNRSITVSAEFYVSLLKWEGLVSWSIKQRKLHWRQRLLETFFFAFCTKVWYEGSLNNIDT